MGECLRVRTKTSVTGLALQRNMKKIFKKWKLKKVSKNKNVHLTGDRASNNVLAGDQMTIKFTSGALHGFMGMVKGSVKRIISPKWRKPGQRVKKRNGFYRKRFKNVLFQSRSFAKFTKSRGLNHNFSPRMKLVKEVRFNTLATHYEPFVVPRNWSMISQVLTHWDNKKKLTDAEKDHKYRDLLDNKQFVCDLYSVLILIKHTFS